MTEPNPSHHKIAEALLRRKVVWTMASGVGLLAVPVGVWWWWARRERREQHEAYHNRVQRFAMGSGGGSTVMDTYDYIITEKIQAGDVLLFDRRCVRCAASPWAALACVVSKTCLTHQPLKSYSTQAASLNRYDHVGLVVPGYINKRADEWDPTNLLVLEATASGIVARPIKERLELSASHSILLLQLACPGEQRTSNDQQQYQSDSHQHVTTASTSSSSSTVASVTRTRAHVERELQRFRDTWTQNATVMQQYAAVHSTVTLGGALVYRIMGNGTGRNGSSSSGISSSSLPVFGSINNNTALMVHHPASYFVLSGLQAAAAAAVVSDAETRATKPGDFLRDYRATEEHVVQLRPGWRFLPPIPLKQSASSMYS